MSDTCDHTDLQVDQCAHCRPKPAGTGRHAAEYRGTCTVCLTDINLGDYVSHTRSGWAHTRCVAIATSGGPW